MNRVAEDILMHYGMPRRSGRYPWGSGDDPYQRTGDFLSRIKELQDKGFSEKQIAEAMGLSTTQLRSQKALAKDEHRSLDVATARGLREKGYSLNEIARQMGYANDSSVRSLLNERTEARMNQAKTTADFLREQVKAKKMIDVGVGTERELGISKEKLGEALSILESEGYEIYGAGIPQVTNPGKQTNMKVLALPGTEHKDVYDFGEVHSLRDYISYDNGETFKPSFVYPKSMDSNRIKIRYAEEGGEGKDGLIEIRRNVDDLSLGTANYSQIRILVDDVKYMKGMALYSDDIPEGVDLVFNTNKKLGTPKEKVFKDISNDPENPFGSLIKEHGGQSYYIDKDGKQQLSLINKRADEGDWNEWADHLPAQFLAKQNLSLIKKQLSLAEADKVAELDEILSYTNPTVKKKLLQSYADDADAAAVHLQAAALPRQKYRVIMPIPEMKDTEVYAPTYENGERVALVRFPHGGTFEIPIVTVNNKQPDAVKRLGNAPDAIGINKKVAERMSGADFDGDTVMVIPTSGKVHITSTPSLFKDFDHKMEYPNRPGMKTMKNTQTEMGKISNLITDMTLKGATDVELAQAVKHSMVVIDAEKHGLDYQKSYIDNNIGYLTKRYKGRIEGDGSEHTGASTLLTRAGSEVSVIRRRGSPKIDPVTGEQHWNEVENPTYVDSKGKTKTRTQKSTQMMETRDARTLSTGTPQEEAYASYANKMKSLANTARKEMLNTGKIEYSRTAKATYAREVDELTASLNVALKNAPREREAQRLASTKVTAVKKDNPDITNKEVKKISQQALNSARNTVGAKRNLITITDRQWEAIQAGAISENVLKQILDNTDLDAVKARALPRSTTTLSQAKISKIQSMSSSGYSTSEIAKALGVSTSTVTKQLSGKG